MRGRVEALVEKELEVDFLDGVVQGESPTILRGLGPGDQRCPVKSVTGELMGKLNKKTHNTSQVFQALPAVFTGYQVRVEV